MFRCEMPVPSKTSYEPLKKLGILIKTAFVNYKKVDSIRVWSPIPDEEGN